MRLFGPTRTTIGPAARPASGPSWVVKGLIFGVMVPGWIGPLKCRLGFDLIAGSYETMWGGAQTYAAQADVTAPPVLRPTSSRRSLSQDEVAVAEGDGVRRVRDLDREVGDFVSVGVGFNDLGRRRRRRRRRR